MGVAANLPELSEWVLPTWRKVIPIYSILLQSKIFLMYIDVYSRTSPENILAKRRILKNFPNTEIFLLF